MRLPGAAAYMEALQDPATCFSDPELAAAAPALGPLGLPRAVSGNVAVVFRLDGARGRSWAVRCFVRPVDAERARYEALRAHLSGLDSPWRVGFDLQPLGIRVDGGWWPIVKMEWAAGEPLLAYVQRHLWDGATLGYLAARVASLAERLRADGVAHGDLQHGNILVARGGDLRLVDYDGMYVPALAGWTGTERGHRNYQHPGRAVGDFGPRLDSFSAWTIYASIAALAADPLLWGRLDGGEEALLLRHHDLEHPDRSAGLAAMEASQAPAVVELARMLRSFLAVRPDEVPPLSLALAPAAGVPAAGGRFAPERPAGEAPAAGIVTARDVGANPATPAPAPSPGAPTYVSAVAGEAALAAGAAAMRRAWAIRLPGGGDGHAVVAPSAPDLAHLPAEAAGAGTGAPPDDAVRAEERRRSLYDALTAAGAPERPADRPAPPPQPAPAFSGDLGDARRTAAGYGGGALLALLSVVVGVPILLALVGALGAAGRGVSRLRRLYLLTPEARVADRVGAVLAGPRRAAGDAVAAVDGLARRRAEVSTNEEAAARKADEERVRLRVREDAELRGVDAGLEATLAALVERERSIGQAEKEARAAALVGLQTSVLDAQLAQHNLVMAAAAGVGDKVVYRLALDGVRTAADFTDVTVEKKGGVVVARDGRRLQVNGLDQRQAAAMVQWRRRVTGVAQLKVPDALPPERLASIRADHDRLRSSLAAEEEAARADARRRADAVRARWEAEHDAVVQRQKQVEADFARQRVELDRDLARARKDVAEAEWRLGQHQEEAGAPAELHLADYLRQVVAVGPLAGMARRPASRTHSRSARERTSSPQA